MNCTLPHCKTVIISSLDKLEEADKHVFTHGKVKSVCVRVTEKSLLAVSVAGEGRIEFVKEA